MIHIDAIYYVFVSKTKSIKRAIVDYKSYKYIKEGTLMRTYLKRKFPKTESVNPTDTLDFLAKYVQ